MRSVRLWVAIEIAVFGAAALLHSGTVLPQYAHSAAETAESVIAAVLAVGLIVSLGAPAWTRAVGLGVQAFALLGTIVGIGTIVAGIGPRTALDLTIHGTMVVLLVSGLVVTGRRRI